VRFVQNFRVPNLPFGNLSAGGVPRYAEYMPDSGTKRSPKMVTIRNLHEMKAAANGNDPQTKLLILGLGEAIVTTCGMARIFLGNDAVFGRSTEQ
jgi:hypothetical protein